MSKYYQVFRLKVDKINQDCRFELSWENGQHLEPIYVTYPQELSKLYQNWQRVYKRYYHNSFRGKIAEQGNLPPMNLHAQLMQAEVKLLQQLRTWLGSEKLVVIRSKIASLIKQWLQENSRFQINLLISCSDIELEKLPWEAWNLETEIASPVAINLLRTTKNISSYPAVPRKKNSRVRYRVLAIFGDATGLDFTEDIKTLNSLSSIAEIKTIIWSENQSIDQYKIDICQAIADKKGWDMIFFTGHSDENAELGGQILIAPKTSIALQELTPYLKIAKSQGLQFALFNSCSGLNIANALIELGLNQVIILREPIQNTAAQVFLAKFIQALASEKNVNESLRETRQYLQEQKNLNYPSAYLIPSLFCHPSADFFAIENLSWKSCLKQWLPNRQQLLTLSFLAIISLLPPVQQNLLNQRTLLQAIYRDLTQQIPKNVNPPVVLVSIDQDSLNAANITEPNPLNRQYLAQIIDKLTTFKTQVIAIDYLLDRPQGDNDSILAQSIQKAREKHKTSFIFASLNEGDQEIGIIPNLASLKEVMQGSITAFFPYLTMSEDCYLNCPFGYLTAVSYSLKTDVIINDSEDYKTQILNSLYQNSSSDNLRNFLQDVQVHPLTQFSEYLQQRWLNPILDFSLPPDTIYRIIPAHQLLKNQESINLEKQVVLIASGGYSEAGIDGEKDYFEPPLAIAFWHPDIIKLTGGEIHAYMIHHWLNQHLVIPIPDFWLVVIACILGQLIVINLESSSRFSKLLILKLITGNFLYILLSLQVYITLKILLPWLLPSLTFWLCVVPYLREKYHEN
jgi:CHASE2 domain-containing sensor protein